MFNPHQQFISSCGNMVCCGNGVWNMVFVCDASIRFDSDYNIIVHTNWAHLVVIQIDFNKLRVMVVASNNLFATPSDIAL